jgi:hypothetical protein
VRLEALGRDVLAARLRTAARNVADRLEGRAP